VQSRANAFARLPRSEFSVTVGPKERIGEHVEEQHRAERDGRWRNADRDEQQSTASAMVSINALIST